MFKEMRKLAQYFFEARSRGLMPQAYTLDRHRITPERPYLFTVNQELRGPIINSPTKSVTTRSFRRIFIDVCTEILGRDPGYLGLTILATSDIAERSDLLLRTYNQWLDETAIPFRVYEVDCWNYQRDSFRQVVGEFEQRGRVKRMLLYRVELRHFGIQDL